MDEERLESADERSRQAADALVEEARGLPPGAFLSLAWFPPGDYGEAIKRWQSFGEQWAGVAHPDYCLGIERHLKRVAGRGVPVRAIAPLVLAEYLPWCEEQGVEPDAPDSSSRYAAERAIEGQAIPWPPGRNDDCWCGSGRKYKKCCGVAEP